MNNIEIGKTEDGNKLNIDLDRLLETRLLIQANSGGGKSYLIRKFLEESYGKVQQIVLDLEGEFSTLREKFDYIVAGKDADLPVNVKTAELLAKKVLELQASIIIDLYELKHHERIKFVKLFLDSMINAPKELWHPVMVVIDEAHIFVPEKGESEAMGSVIDLATRGRKRGFCCVLATQRLSKLHKDAAAECINKLIGRTGLDIDMKRASEELGFTTKQQMLSLRDLEAGNFYAFGSAISKEIVKVKIGAVETSHPKLGQRKTEVPIVKTEKVKSILAKLTDLPKEAEKELLDKQSMIKRIRELEHEARQKGKAEVPKEELEKIKNQSYELGYKKGQNESLDQAKQVNITNQKLVNKIEQIGKIIGQDIKITPMQVNIKPTYSVTKSETFKAPTVAVKKDFVSIENGTGELGKCERAIIQFLAMREGRFFTKSQIGAMTGYSNTSGGFNNALSRLRTEELIKQQGDRISVRDEAVPKIIELLGADYQEPSTDALEQWLNKLGLCAKKLYQVLLENRTETYSKEQLGDLTGYSSTSGGFNNAISELCTLGLAERTDEGIRLNAELLEV